MKTFNIKIDYRDLLSEEEANKITEKEMLEKVKEIVTTSILSGLSDHTGPEGRTFIRGSTARMADYFLDIVEASDDGVVSVNDNRAAQFQELWTGRLQQPAIGWMRRLIQRIDRRICPDEYTSDKATPQQAEAKK